MIRIERSAALAALVLAVAGCNGPAPSAQPGATASVSAETAAAAEAGETAAQAAASAAPPPSLAAAAQGQRIDVEPAAGAASRIVASENIEVARKPACALTVQYAGDIDQPATWRGERCDALTMRFVGLGELAAIGQDRKLDARARETIAGLPGRKVLYIEGAHASAIFAPNEAGLLERHDLAD